MEKKSELKNYMVEILFKDGTTQEWRTDKVDTGEVHWSYQNKCYFFKNDRGGETHIAADEVVVVSTYVDTSEEVELPKDTVVTPVRVDINSCDCNRNRSEDIIKAIKQLPKYNKNNISTW